MLFVGLALGVAHVAQQIALGGVLALGEGVIVNHGVAALRCRTDEAA